MMKKNKKVQKVDSKRLSNGKFGPGNCANPSGRPRKPEIEELRQALEYAQKTHNKSFLQHFCERAYESDPVAIALARKLISDKIEGEGFGDQITNLFQNITTDGRPLEAIIADINSRLSAQFRRKR
jgi:hypothetical protein